MLEPTGDGPTISPPAPRAPAPEPLAEMRAMLEAANAATAAAKAEREALAKLLEDSRKEPAKEVSPAAPDTKYAVLEERLERIRKDALVEAVKGMGLVGEWPRDRILRNVPDVDAGTESGRIALEQFREANKDLFRRADATASTILEEQIRAATARSPGVAEHPIFGDAYVAKVFQANFTERAQ